MRKLMVTVAIVLAVLAILLIGGYAPLRGAGEAPQAGTAAPDFTLNSQDGAPVSLHDFRGKWVVLYFYPKDFTSGCTIEAHNFQRDLAEYEQRNAVILGVSVQDEKTHQAFCTKEGLHFKLLADTQKEVSGRYGSLMNLMFTKLSSRHTFLIDPQGIIRKVWLIVHVQTHSRDVLSALDAPQNSPAR
jgi:thioredoxin-dependent peroxiredoxin